MVSILLFLAAAGSTTPPMCTIIRYPLVRHSEHAALILEALPDTSFAELWHMPEVIIASDAPPDKSPFPVYAQAFR